MEKSDLEMYSNKEDYNIRTLRTESKSIKFWSLSTITESDETNISSSLHDDGRLSTDEFSTSSSNTPSSPLPPLIIEEEPNKHDEPEEFYKRLKRRMLKAHRQLLIEGRSDVSNLSYSTLASPPQSAYRSGLSRSNSLILISKRYEYNTVDSKNSESENIEDTESSNDIEQINSSNKTLLNDEIDENGLDIARNETSSSKADYENDHNSTTRKSDSRLSSEAINNESENIEDKESSDDIEQINTSNKTLLNDEIDENGSDIARKKTSSSKADYENDHNTATKKSDNGQSYDAINNHNKPVMPSRRYSFGIISWGDEYKSEVYNNKNSKKSITSRGSIEANEDKDLSHKVVENELRDLCRKVTFKADVHRSASDNVIHTKLNQITGINQEESNENRNSLRSFTSEVRNENTNQFNLNKTSITYLVEKSMESKQEGLPKGIAEVNDIRISQINEPDTEKQSISTENFQYEAKDTQKNAPDLLEDNNFSDTNNRHEGASNENTKELRQNNTRKRPGEEIVVEDIVLEKRLKYSNISDFNTPESIIKNINESIEITKRVNEMAASFERAAISDALKSPILTTRVTVKKKCLENFSQKASKYRSDIMYVSVTKNRKSGASFDNMKEVTQINPRKRLGEEIVAEDIVLEKRPSVISIPKYSNISDFNTPECIIQSIKESIEITERVNDMAASFEKTAFSDALKSKNFTQKASEYRSDTIYDFNTSESTIENIRRSSNITKKMKVIKADREKNAFPNTFKEPNIPTNTSVKSANNTHKAAENETVQSSDKNLNENENRHIEVMRSARVGTSADSLHTRANEGINVTDNVFRDTSRHRPHSKEDTLRESGPDTNAPNFDNTINSNILNISRNGGHWQRIICNDTAFIRRDLTRIHCLLSKIHRTLSRKQKSAANLF